MTIAAQTLVCSLFAAGLVCALFFGSGTLVPQAWGNALFPGFFVSAMFTVREHAGFGNGYVALGLFLNTAMCVAVLLLGSRLVRNLRHHARNR
jgi:hypothetical protein